MRISTWIVCVVTSLPLLHARPDPGPDADHSGKGIDFSKAVDDPETGLQVMIPGWRFFLKIYMDDE